MPRIRLVEDPAGAFGGAPAHVHVVHGHVGSSLRAPGPLVLAPGARIEGDVDARGAVHIARGVLVGGAVRAIGEVILGAGASVARGIRAEGRVVAQTGAVVTGLVDAAGDVHLFPRCRVEQLLVGGDLHVARPVVAPKVRVRGRTFVDET